MLSERAQYERRKLTVLDTVGAPLVLDDFAEDRGSLVK